MKYREKEEEGPKLEKHRDGSVWKRLVCSCGNSVYKKNLTNGTITFLARGADKEIRSIPLNNVTQQIIKCEMCGKEHIDVGIFEGMGIVEEFTVAKDFAGDNI